MNNKIRFTFFSISALFLIIISKAAYIQIFNKEKLLKYSNSQMVRKVVIHPKRGTIYDRNLNPLAINIETYNIFVIPKKNEEYRSSFKELDKILKKRDFEKNLSQLRKRNKFTWLYRNIIITHDQAEEIKLLKNIELEKIPQRIYPNNELLSQTLGFVGIDNKGLSGIELSFNKDLEGEEQIIKYFRDAKGRPVKLKSIDHGIKSKDLVLSIDKEVQAITEKSLKEAILKHKAQSGGVVVIDPNNGEIISLANYPTFDPNEIKSSKGEYQKLSIITDPFEPGSIFKTVTVLSGLENKIIRPDSSYYCEEGKLKVENHYISEAESKKKFEWLSVEEILKYSSNVGTTKIAFDISYPRLKDTIDKFHFGKKTNIELMGESKGIYKTEIKNVRPLELSNISFGQGIGTTAIQMATFYSAIANGGYLIEPTLVKDKIVNKKKVIDSNIANELTEMLIKAVEDGTGDNAKMKLIKVAGKTSTAQKIINGKYSSYISGFIGFPVNVKNKYVTFVYIEDPTEGGYYGNIVAAPVFRKINEYLLFKHKEYDHLIEKDIALVDSKDSLNIIQSSTERRIQIGLVPNFIGLDKVNSIKMANKVGAEIEISGYGVVSSQIPEVGQKYQKNEKIKLIFSPPNHD